MEELYYMSDGFPFAGHGKPADDLIAIRDEIFDGEMPPLSYRFMHWSAKPSDSERDSIIVWVRRSLASLASVGLFPADSVSATVNTNSGAVYVCPMHPGETSDNICGSEIDSRRSAIPPTLLSANGRIRNDNRTVSKPCMKLVAIAALSPPAMP